ncbi:hypothetical protein BGZ63DRAFT_402111 [Mariannaea sp. PMI_226]|nr:hypothetical protein BGZ63DRAFT_402111 [Mariannaea sp. PMI_226]
MASALILSSDGARRLCQPRPRGLNTDDTSSISSAAPPLLCLRHIVSAKVPCNSIARTESLRLKPTVLQISGLFISLKRPRYAGLRAILSSSAMHTHSGPSQRRWRDILGSAMTRVCQQLTWNPNSLEDQAARVKIIRAHTAIPAQTQARNNSADN